MKQQESWDFDAVVVGSGITGGWVAKELCERGLRVLVLERGKPIEHGKDYVGEHMPPWKIPFGGKPLRDLYARDYYIQSKKSYAFDETTRHFWNNDRLNPYQQDAARPFHWFRADVVGGRSLLWARQVYRWSDLDFSANKREGVAIDWPLRYADVAPWYSHVERFIGVSGRKENLPQLPDGEFQPPMEMNAGEKIVKQRIEAAFPGRVMTIGRVAVLTRPLPGRAACHYCGICARGCSAGAYFSSLSSTLPAARRTGNLHLEANSVVAQLEYDPALGRVSHAQVVDTLSRQRRRVSARLFFLCASTVGSTQILLNSSSASFPQGLANRSGALGHYLMDHHSGAGALAALPSMPHSYYYGDRPNGIYIPRFRNLSGMGEEGEEVDFQRGYGYQGLALRSTWHNMHQQLPGFGAAFKQSLRAPGPWGMYLSSFGECLPYRENRMELDGRHRDRFGIPQVRFSFAFGDNEMRQRRDAAAQAEAMLRATGATQVIPFNPPAVGGGAIHEMGTARMGNDPRESVLNRWNQAHDVPNLYVADGACMSSSSCVNPSMTYMALAARAANHAVEELRGGRS